MENYKGYSIKLEQDDCYIDPRKDFDHAASMVCFHKRYSLPNESSYHASDFDSWNDLQSKIESNNLDCFILPIYMYDHSGVTISTKPFSCPYDSGQIGFIFISRNKAKSEYGIKHFTQTQIDRVFSYLISEVTEYNQFLTGDVWYYTISKDEELIDSCGGFYGFHYAMQQAKEAIDDHITFEAKNHGVQTELNLSIA